MAKSTGVSTRSNSTSFSPAGYQQQISELKGHGKGQGNLPREAEHKGQSDQMSNTEQQSVEERREDACPQGRMDVVGIHEHVLPGVPPEDTPQTSGGEGTSSTTTCGQESASRKTRQTPLEPKISETTLELARRPGYGKLGTKIDLIANYFKLNFKDISIFHYDVDIFFRERNEEGSNVKERKATTTQEKEEEEEEELLVEELTKGRSILKQEKTKRKDVKEGASHIEHQQKTIPGKKLRRKIITQMMSTREYQRCNPVYDGEKNVYTTKPLPVTKKERILVTLEENGRRTTFLVVIQPVMKDTSDNTINLEPLHLLYDGRSVEIPQEVLMVFDTVLCHRSPPFRQVQLGRSFFLLDQIPYSLDRGAEVWFGYNQSVHLTNRGLQVIVNFTGKAFYKQQRVIDFATDVLKKNVSSMTTLSSEDVAKVREALKGTRVRVTHRKRKPLTAEGLTEHGAASIRFNINGQDTTVAKYFLDTYNIRLRYQDLPCVEVKKTKKTFFPMEICEIVHQPISGELPKDRASKMIKKMALPPVKRFEEITKERNQLQEVSGEAMNNFGLDLEMTPMALQGRILVPPQLKYGGASEPMVVSPDECGRWKMDGRKFLKSCEARTWMLFSLATIEQHEGIKNHKQSLKRFANDMTSNARKVHMDLKEPLEIQHFRSGETVSTILSYAKERNVAFVVIVLPGKSKLYNEIKFLADVKRELVTQCVVNEVVEKNLSRDPRDRNSYITAMNNILLKLNYKLGGINHALLQPFSIFKKPFIIFGADVIHSVRSPSIAALVGSLDATPAQYAVTCRIQKHRNEKKKSEEIISDLKNMAKSILETFTTRTRGKYPEKIIFFRDGVSEGQFKTVLREVRLVQEACVDVLGGFVPPMTFVIVQKKHQTRFRPLREEDGVGRMKNVPPGTTVDTDVTHPIFFDFFLCSHEGIQGTSKPAHYTVIFDENNFSADELQKLCYHLCFVYARCNRSISVPPPVMYADLACTRANKYVSYLMDKNPDTPKLSEFRELPKEAVDTINQGVAIIKSPMFFL